MQVLRVPSKALRFTPEKILIGDKMTISDCSGEEKVWTLQGNTLTAHPVKTGITNGTYTEIVSGIQQGNDVVTEISLDHLANTQASPSSEGEGNTERSPFMPGPPGRNNNKRK